MDREDDDRRREGGSHVSDEVTRRQYALQAPLPRPGEERRAALQGTMPALFLLTSLSTSMPKSGAAHGATPRWSKTRLCFVVMRSGCGCDRAPATNEATDADSVRIQWMRLFPATIFVLVLGDIAFPFSCAGLWLILALRHEKGYKICANGQTGSAVCMQRLIVQELLGIISPHDEDARGLDPERWSHRYQSDSITVMRHVRGDRETC